MHGGMYGDREQSTVVVLACEPDQLDVSPYLVLFPLRNLARHKTQHVAFLRPSNHQIKLISHSYSFSTATLSMAFSSAKFCASTEGEGDNKDRKEPEAPSKPDQGTGQSEGGWGFFSWLFFLIFSGLALYFAVGMWIRHSQCGFSLISLLQCNVVRVESSTLTPLADRRRRPGLGHAPSPRLLGRPPLRRQRSGVEQKEQRWLCGYLMVALPFIHAGLLIDTHCTSSLSLAL